MPTTQRERTLAAACEDVWAVIEDPHHMPRWWPGVTRMESVEEDSFTQVFISKRGKPVRADFRVLASDPPRRRAWRQELSGTPFERVLEEAVTEILLEAAPEGTRVTIAQRQKLRGYSRTGGFLVRRAAVEKLDEALDGLERLLG
jgi:uncharacterized protein YndB with AHSA1/START domain